MDLRFEPITAQNRRQAEALRPFPEQAGFIETVRDCLAEADSIKLWRPVGIYDQEKLVGFAMYGCFPESQTEDSVWLDRLLIDWHEQGKGYGKSAVAALLQLLQQEYHCTKIYLSVYGENQVAIKLYQQLGFQFNGKLDMQGEKIMIYVCSAQNTCSQQANQD